MLSDFRKFDAGLIGIHIAGCEETCEPLVAAGWMVRGKVINQNTEPMQIYHVTNKGARAAGVLNRLRREDRYA